MWESQWCHNNGIAQIYAYRCIIFSKMDTVSLLYYMSILLFCSTNVDSSSTWLHSRWSRRVWFPAQHARHDHRRVLRQAAACDTLMACVTLSWPRNSTEIRQEPKPFMLFLWVHNDINCQDPRSVKTMAELKTQCLLTSSVNIDNNLNINFRIRIHSRSLLLLIFCPVLV